MCVATWAELTTGSHKSSLVPAEGVAVRYMEENIGYSLKDGHIDILVLAAIEAETRAPFLFHMVHRRCVRTSDYSGDMVHPSLPLARARDALRGRGCGAPTEPDNFELEILGSGTPTRVAGRIPRDQKTDAPLGFAEDFTVSGDRGVVPFTSVCFGPLEPSRKPYILGLRLTIDSPAFETLVNRVNQYGVKFHYGIEGPEIVRSDIRNVDLFGLPPSLAATYSRLFTEGVERCHVPILEYGVLTYDSPGEGHCQYNRVYVQAEHVLRDEPLCLASGEEYRVNGWHSSREDFLIQRVSLFQR